MDDRIALVEDLFTAWSSGDPDAPRPYLTEDAVLAEEVLARKKLAQAERARGGRHG